MSAILSSKFSVWKYLPSCALKELDPIAYNCGFTDWLGAENLTTDESEAQ